MTILNIAQLNCNHAKACETNIWKEAEQSVNQACFLLQEPYYVKGGKIRNLNNNFNVLYKKKNNPKPRTCIILSKKMNGYLISQFSSRDMTVCCIKLNGTCLYFCSLSMPGGR